MFETTSLKNILLSYNMILTFNQIRIMEEEVKEIDKDQIIENLRSINKTINDKLRQLNRGLDLAMDKVLLT